MNRSRMLVIARTDLRQLRESPDFWVPMLILAGLFFVVIPAFLLFAITHVGNTAVITKVASTLDVLPPRAKAAIRHQPPSIHAVGQNLHMGRVHARFREVTRQRFGNCNHEIGPRHTRPSIRPANQRQVIPPR